MVLVMMFGATSCEPSTVRTGMPAPFRRLKFFIAFSNVMFAGRGCWKRSPAIIMKSGFNAMVLSTSSSNAFSKSSRLASSPYCE